MPRARSNTVPRKTAVDRPATAFRWMALLGILLMAPPLSAQDTNAPAAPATPPVAAPVDQTATPPDNSTNAAPSGGLIVTTPAAAQFDSAMTFFNTGQFADAVTAFSGFVRDFPQDRRREEALYRLAESYRSLGRTDDALAAYTYQVQNYPDGPLRSNGELRRGAILFDAGKFADALAPLQFVADKGDGELQQAAKYLLGRSLLATQKEADGRADLQALADEPSPGKFSGAAAQTLAELDDAQNKYPEALTLWQKALALSTDPAVQATAAARGGWSALQAKQPDVAEKLFQTARQLDAAGDSRKVANTGLLRILFQQKRYSEWLALYTAEKEKLLDSARSEILYDLGHANFALKHWPDAVAGFDQYLSAYGTQDTAVTAAYERFLALAQLNRAKTVSEAEAYLKAWPKSPYRARVRLLEAQELSRENKFAEALPLWENLADVTEDAPWPHQDILLELARAYDELNNFPKAATAYQNYLDDLDAHPGADKEAQARNVLHTQARLAVCLQKADQLLAATDAWKAVQSLAPEGSREQETALESLGLIYARGGPAQEADLVATFRALLEKFPQKSAARPGRFFRGRFVVQKSRLPGRRAVPPERPHVGRQKLAATGDATAGPRRVWPEGFRQNRGLRERVRHDPRADRSAGPNRRPASRGPLLLAGRDRAESRPVGRGRDRLCPRHATSRSRRSAGGVRGGNSARSRATARSGPPPPRVTNNIAG